ncbi:MAG TPA: ATP-binding protein [bacterium]
MASRKLEHLPVSLTILKALAVTENPSGIRGLSTALREAGTHSARVVSVRPRDLKAALEEDSFAVLIIEDSPPRCDALDLLRLASGVPAIVLCHTDHETRILDLLKAGAFDALTRRQTLEGLLPYALRRALGSPHRMQEELERRLEKHMQAEAALQESNRRFRLALKNSADTLRERAQLFNVVPDAIIVRGMDDRITFWNSGAERMYGWTEDEAVGYLACELMKSEYSLPMEELKAHVLREGYYATEIRQTARDGRRMIVQSLWAVRRNDGGEPISFLQINRDITDLKQSAQGDTASEIRHQREALEAVIAEHTAQIRKLQHERLENEQQAALGRMAAHIAHEINNPLAGVGMAFKVVKKSIPKDAEHYEFVGRIERELKRVARIVHQMFGLYRPENEVPVPCNPADAIQDVIMLLQSDTRVQEVTIHADVARAARIMLVHEDALKQVLFNILQNAIEASPQGGDIRVEAEIDEDTLTLSVADQGCGIPPEDQARIYERFFTTKSGQIAGGLGLGLAVTHSILERIGGSIHFDSEVNRGTTFHISLPVEPE